jgi:hypothetical protein
LIGDPVGVAPADEAEPVDPAEPVEALEADELAEELELVAPPFAVLLLELQALTAINSARPATPAPKIFRSRNMNPLYVAVKGARDPSKLLVVFR